MNRMYRDRQATESPLGVFFLSFRVERHSLAIQLKAVQEKVCGSTKLLSSEDPFPVPRPRREFYYHLVYL